MSCPDGQAPAESGRPAPTPLPVTNPPGRPAIRRRVATHATARATMTRALSRPALAGAGDLSARTDDDFAIALLDAAAVVVDVLTFYTDRLAGEHYLRTATEARSVAELARLLGYQPAPALAATADLAFTLDPTPGAPARSLIATGTAVQSVPGPGEQPVVYETLADLEASPAWNALRPRPRGPHPESAGHTLAFAGAVTGVTVGDGVLFRTGAGPTDEDAGRGLAFGVVRAVRPVDAVPELPGRPGAPARTEVDLATLDYGAAPVVEHRPPDDLLPATATTLTAAGSAAWLAGRRVSATDLDTEALAHRTTLDEVARAFAGAGEHPAEALLFRQRHALFGGQAPLTASLAEMVALEVRRSAGAPAEVVAWASQLSAAWDAASAQTFPRTRAAGEIYLEGAAPVPADSLVVLRDANHWGGYRVLAADAVSLTVLTISGRATRVRLDSPGHLGAFSIHGTTAYAAPERLALADVAEPEALDTAVVELDGLALGLRAGRRVVVTGEPVGDAGHTVTHPTTLAGVVHDFGPRRSTTVTLADQLPVAMSRPTTRILANVATASHGETRREVLGSGDARQVFQRFGLRQPPLTHLSAATASGLADTLTVWVGDVRWARVDSFQGAGPDDRVYVLQEQAGIPVVQFGDGITGARLPTGAANVRAAYRSGAGLAGRVRAGQLSQPRARAGGVTAVVNPAPGVGGDDPEPLASARAAAPARVAALDRVVSMADYALFARGFPGVAKAHAVRARAGGRAGVALTVAGRHGERLDPRQGTGANLLAALRTYGDPAVPVALLPHEPVPFRLVVAARTAPDRDRAAVLAAASSRLTAAFSFDTRELGQPVAASEVVAVLQATPGVVAATVTGLRVPGSIAATVGTVGFILTGFSFPSAERAGAAERTGASGAVNPEATSGSVGTLAAPTELLAAGVPTPGADLATARGAEILVLDTAPIGWEEL
ncbi:putative baseplate assembly protein [Frankia sp. CN6]|uniref:Baseplate assembly protein n=1 Tax=Frankia nepalensis TaxID=1836974 RepID=A0A937RIB2_9ACTN|nr:putative baseplate assembly protein [Frankia nepalensis]MBL7626531.1 putative baseplate assembly protein [Frankia nepalensis]